MSVKKYFIGMMLIGSCSNYSIEHDEQIIKNENSVNQEVMRDKDAANNQRLVKHFTGINESFSHSGPEQYCTYANLSIGYIAADDELDQSANERKSCTPSAVSGCLKFKHKKRSSSL